MIKGIIFDFDGVVVKSNYPGAHVLEKILKKHGIKKTPKELYPHFGEHPKQIFREMLHHRNIEKIFGEYMKIMTSAAYVRKVKTVKNAKRALFGLKKKYRLAVASGAVRVSLMKIMKRNGLGKYFIFVVTCGDGKRCKPRPDMLNESARRMKLKKREVIYVGDAPNDALAAKNAGIKIAAVLTGVMDRKAARKMKADYIISDITKLGRLLEKVNGH